jgi:hypothetical protein
MPQHARKGIESGRPRKRPGDVETPRGRHQEVSPDAISTLQALQLAARVRRDAVKNQAYRATPLGRLVGKYLDQLAFENYAASTRKNREATLAKLALDMADFESDAVTPDDLRDFLTQWKDTKPNTRAAYTSTVKVFFTWAHDHDHIPADPARKLRGPRAKDTEKRAHPQEVIKQLVLAQDSQRDRVALELI